MVEDKVENKETNVARLNFTKSIVDFFSNFKYHLLWLIAGGAIATGGTYYFIKNGTDKELNTMRTTLTSQSTTIDSLRDQNKELARTRDELKQTNNLLTANYERLLVITGELSKSSGAIIDATNDIGRDISEIAEREQSALNTISKLIDTVKSSSSGE